MLLPRNFRDACKTVDRLQHPSVWNCWRDFILLFFFFDALEDALYLFISLLDPTFADRIFSNICFIGT